jgi:hypothetical protein
MHTDIQTPEAATVSGATRRPAGAGIPAAADLSKLKQPKNDAGALVPEDAPDKAKLVEQARQELEEVHDKGAGVVDKDIQKDGPGNQPPRDNAVSSGGYDFPDWRTKYLPHFFGAKVTTTVLSTTAGVAGFLATTGAVWKIGHALGKSAEYAAMTASPYFGLVGGVLCAAMGYSFGAWTVRNAIDNQIRGKIDLSKESFDDPHQMYLTVRAVRDTLFDMMRIPARFAQRIDEIIETRGTVDQIAAALKERIKKLPKIPPTLAESITKQGGIYGIGYFGENLAPKEENGKMTQPLLSQWNAYLEKNPGAKPELEMIVEEDRKLRDRLDIERMAKELQLREVLRQVDYWKRPPVGMKGVVKGIRGLQLDDKLKEKILENYIPGELALGIENLRTRSVAFKRKYDAALAQSQDLESAIQKLITRDNAIKDQGRMGALVERVLSPFGVKVRMRRTLGLDYAGRKEDENRYERPRWFLFTRPRPYTSTPFNPKLWSRQEFDLGKRAELFVTALNNTFKHSIVFKGVGDLTQTNIKGLIAGEFRDLQLNPEKKALSTEGHEFVKKGFQEQLAERYNYVFLKVDSLFQSLLKGEHARAIGIASVVAPLGLTIVAHASGFKWTFFDAVRPAVQPLIDLFF